MISIRFASGLLALLPTVSTFAAVVPSGIDGGPLPNPNIPKLYRCLHGSIDVANGTADIGQLPNATAQLKRGSAHLSLDLSPVHRIHRAIFLIHYAAASEGWSVDIGQSPTNNGYGGDGWTKTRDAELQVLDNGLSLYGDDTVDAALMASSHVSLTAGSVLTVVVGDNFAAWSPAAQRPLHPKPLLDILPIEPSNFVLWSDDLIQGTSKRGPWLFSLSGQPDAEAGAPTYDLHAAFNRVVAIDEGRTGSGVDRVEVHLLVPIEPLRPVDPDVEPPASIE